jgi:hypothetical protein
MDPSLLPQYNQSFYDDQPMDDQDFFSMINTSSTPKPPGLQESADGASGKKGRKKRGKLKYIFNCMC